jgi:tryptophan synthase alpha chain
MGYLNPLLAFGVEAFFTRAAAAGVDAVILPDLPPEEAAPLREAAQRAGLSIIAMLAPTSTAARREAVLQVASGFTYFVAVTGVTGARTEQADVSAELSAIRAQSSVPVVVGFGISTPQQARAAAAHADGVVVGSAIVERIARGEPLEPFIASLRAAIVS